MSRTLHEATNVPCAGIGDYPPQSAPTQASQGVPNFVDGSGPIFSMYLEMATEEDKKMVENWKADADGILIFTGLFSAAVASLISVSIQDVRPNSQDTSNFYLANIYQILSDPNRSNISSSLPASPPPFSPPNYSVWVNSLWFLSLVISLACALLATLLQRWARRYLKVTQSRYSPHKRAQIRAFFSEGVDKFLLPWAVETLPTLLHVSLFLFFAGLVVFLCNVDLTIFKSVLSWVSICTVLYGCITFMPIFRHDSPYHTPLSLPAWNIVTGIPFVTFRVLRWLTGFPCFSYGSLNRFLDLEGSSRKLLVQGMQKTAEETALNSPSDLVTRAFLWTFDSLDEDHELERFFSGLPGFRSSKVVDDPLPVLTEDQQRKLLRALIGLSDRTFSSDLLPEPVKNRRAVICTKALDPAEIPYAYQWILHRIVYGEHQFEGLRTAEFGLIVKSWADCQSGDKGTALVVRAILTSIVATAQRRNDSWFTLASNELGVQGSVLRDYASDGDSLSLAILTHVTRQQFSLFRDPSWLPFGYSVILQAASNFNVRDTSPKLQREFCALWNQIVLRAQNDNDQLMALLILGPIRNIYVALHHDTVSTPIRFSSSTTDHDHILFEPSSYPLCNVPGHHPDSTPHMDGGSTSTAFARILQHDHNNTALVPSFLASSPDMPPSSTRASVRVEGNFTDVPPLDNNISVLVSLRVDKSTTESRCIPSASPNPATIRATHGSIDTCAKATRLSTLDPSASNPPTKSKALTSPPDVVAVPRNAHRRTPSDGTDIPSSPSPTPVLDDRPLTESHSSMLAPTSSFASLARPTSAPDLSVIVEDGGNPKTGLRKDKDTRDPSPIRENENIMAIPDLPPQPRSPPSVTGVAISDPSLRSLDAKHTGDRPPHPSDSQYDIV
ncbi:hypothetical protein EDB87DRAFT_1686538 [Lactarius vividus]|nr:hypothetical protein EDB87DRAFT_1686538 [Lactarius vividus]